jgi:hypothetical protein
MVLHYGLTLLFVYATSTESYRANLTRAMEQPGLMWGTIAWYLLGQVFIWMSFLRYQSNSQI